MQKEEVCEVNKKNLLKKISPMICNLDLHLHIFPPDTLILVPSENTNKRTQASWVYVAAHFPGPSSSVWKSLILEG